MSRRRGSSWAALGVIVLLVGLLTAGPSGGATLAGGISTADGTSVAVIPMGHFNDPANKFFETFTAGPAGSWVLTTPTGVATNGGIVVASPGANAAAVLPWYLLRYTAVRPLDSAGGGSTGCAAVVRDRCGWHARGQRSSPSYRGSGGASRSGPAP